MRLALLAVFLLTLLAVPAAGNAAAGGRQAGQDVSGGDGYGVILDRVSRAREKGYLDSLQQVNGGLRAAHAALVKGRTAYSILYRRTKQDLEYRRATPAYVLKQMQDLEAEGEQLEAAIREKEAGKRALEAEVTAFYPGGMPQRLARKWNAEEEAYSGYVDALYRQVGWWAQVEYSGQWSNDESRLWDYLRQYYRDHPADLDVLK